MAKTDFAKQSFTGLPKWAKGVVAVIVIGGLAYVGYKLLKAPKKIEENKGNREENRSNNNELEKLNGNPTTRQTLSQSDASAIANKLFTAMDGYGTDVPTIEQQMNRLKNQADWLAVKVAYGIREVSSGKLNPEPNYTGTLEGALASELGINDVMARARVNAAMKKKGITAVI